jgi:endonuclease/exonuclease/phosphatase family metal-dependent hydrolase
MDCGYKHRPSQCYNRQGRIDRLREQIREKQAELAALEEYDRRIASGWEEHESSFERWKRLHAEPLS